MDKLIQLVSEKAGINEDQATQAVHTVVGFLKERLPEPLAGQLDGALGGEGGGEGSSGIAGKFGL